MYTTVAAGNKNTKEEETKKKRTTNGPAERIKQIFPFSGRSHFLLIDDPRTRSRFKEEALDSGKKVVNVCCFFSFLYERGEREKQKKKKMREREGKWGRKKGTTRIPALSMWRQLS